MADFQALLSKRVDETTKPKPLPVGSYMCVVDKREFGESRQKKTPYVRFTFKPLSPGEDVDAEAFNECGGMEAMVKRSFNADFYLTDDAMWRLREHLEDHLGLDIGERSYGEVIEEAPGREVMVNIAHRQSDDGENTYIDVKGFARVA